MNLELTPAALLKQLQSTLPHSHSVNKSSATKILIAYSGGLDSHVLLHLLSKISTDEIHIRAVYINHGLQAQANEWTVHCESVCNQLNIDFKNIDLNLSVPKGESIEELARTARYQALYTELEQDEVLMTAHHQNDQAETLLLQLFRGAGVQGLAAMPKLNQVKANEETYLHMRPLLDQSRQALEAYAKENNLRHIEDPSNQNTVFDRNFLRQEIMPLLRERWLGIDKAISRTAKLQAETQSLLDEMAEQVLPTILASGLDTYNIEKDQTLRFAPIDISRLIKLSQAKQRLLLRYWISQQGFLNPSAKKLQHIFTDLIHSAKDKQPLIEWKGVELRRFQDFLYIMSPLSLHDVTQVIPWRTDRPLYISSLDMTLSHDLIESNQENVTVRFRQGGETIEIPKRGNIRLKNLFQEEQIPPWIRPRLPLIYIGEKLVKVAGLDGLKRHPPTF